jgi:hypothetical protein
MFLLLTITTKTITIHGSLFSSLGVIYCEIVPYGMGGISRHMALFKVIIRNVIR